jgi:putative Mg2+ transporter-C (MgtC) family protein
LESAADSIFVSPDAAQFVRVTARLAVAALLGGLLGYEREREDKPAGFRTHILVALGAALFTTAPLEAGLPIAGLANIIQGIATGIGFIGAGTILKLTERREIHGLTTAAGIWLTAAIGAAVGAGALWVPIVGVVFALITFSILGRLERSQKKKT